jgi:hypothetical protein
MKISITDTGCKGVVLTLVLSLTPSVGRAEVRKAHARQYKADTRRIVLTGESAAAHLVAMAAVPAQSDRGIELIEDLSNWRAPRGDWTIVTDVATDPHDPKRLAWKPGRTAAVNGPLGRTRNLVSVRELGDVEAHIEFMIPAGSNSGVYFMGRYEVQIYDSYGVVKDEYPGIECGGIYPRWINNQNVAGHSPRLNASLPPGQWQTFDVVFHAPRFDAAGRKTSNAMFVKVVHNGKLIHENVEVTGPTRAAMCNDEKPTGPLMLQGDHGPVAYRSVRLRALPPQVPNAAPSP